MDKDVGVYKLIYCNTHTQKNTNQLQKKNEIVTFAATWMMNLEIMILSEISQRKANTI